MITFVAVLMPHSNTVLTCFRNAIHHSLDESSAHSSKRLTNSVFGFRSFRAFFANLSFNDSGIFTFRRNVGSRSSAFSSAQGFWLALSILAGSADGCETEESPNTKCC